VPFTPIFIVITNIEIMIAESTRLAQVEDPVVSTSAEDSALQTSAGEPSAMEFVVAPVAPKATTITVPEVSATTSVSIESAVGLIFTQSELAPVSMDIIRANVERGSGSTPAELSLAMDIMKELVHQMVQQFFTSIRSYIKLVLSERSSFEFAWMLLENQIENIRHARSSKQARTYLTLVEQLGICLKELRTLPWAVR